MTLYLLEGVDVDSASGVDLDFWNRDNELSAPFTNVRILGHNFGLYVPRQNQHKIGLGFPDAVGMIDWNVCPRKKPALFIRVPVDDVIQEVRPDATVVQQRVAFAWGAIADDLLSVPLRRNHKFQQFPFRFF